MTEEKRIVITIDGVAASGKSSLAKALAEKLSFSYLNSGNLYRAVGILASENNIDCSNEKVLLKFLTAGHLELLQKSAGVTVILFDGKELSSSELESIEAGKMASKIAPLQSVRSFLLPIQRAAFPHKNLIAEGRDMGTVVFPNAAIKIFVSAEARVRAERRAKQLGAMESVDLIEKELNERDSRDSTRTNAPMKIPDDAILFDNSKSNFDEQLECLYQKVHQKLKDLRLH